MGIRGGFVNPFNRRVTGTWGQLKTDAGVVPYVLTSARLSRQGTDDEARLLRDLQPVREAIPGLGQEDFGVLLQRPLDDHRVATRLIPYLLKGAAGGVPGFFPSVLVAALPFNPENKEPLPAYEPEQPPQVLDDDEFYGPRRQQVFGGMFRISRLWDPAMDTAHASSLATFEWANERIKLVVLDGQHRAMSLLAIQRNLTTWPTGNPYEQFYDQATNGIGDLDIEGIRLPVTLVWFPPPPGGALDPVRVARSMFVTVNNEARRVGDARILMLNDSELVPLFTRQLLERMRDPQSAAACRVLETVLYEDTSQGGPARAASRWTTLTDLKTLAEGVARTVFYGYANQWSLALYRTGWTPSAQSAAATLHARLQTGNHFPAVNPQDFPPGDLRNDNFPDEWGPILCGLFGDTWGSAILWLYSTEGPFGAHAAAVKATLADWPQTSAPELLAHEAAFEGTGLWSVLENHYKAHVVAVHGPRPNTNPMLAWGLLRDAQEPFEALRARNYLGSAAPTLVERDWVRSLFDTYKTEACQIGLVGAMTLMSLTLGLSGDAIPEFAESMSRALSRALEAPRPEGQTRRFALARRRGPDDPYNTLNLMRHVLQKGNATEFRYMWIQLLTALEAQQQFRADLPDAMAEEAIAAADRIACNSRVLYLRMLHKHRKGELERNGHATPDAEARQEVGRELSTSLNALFDLTLTVDQVWECDQEGDGIEDAPLDAGEDDELEDAPSAGDGDSEEEEIV